MLTWEPDRSYDVVFFANWLSHVPPDAFNRFWEIVSLSLAPEGRVFLVDEAADAWRHEHLREDFIEGHEVPLVRRRLSDGSTHRVVKVFWNPDDLETRLGDLGWNIRVHMSGPLFWATARRS